MSIFCDFEHTTDFTLAAELLLSPQTAKINEDPFTSKSSPNFLPSGGSLDY